MARGPDVFGPRPAIPGLGGPYIGRGRGGPQPQPPRGAFLPPPVALPPSVVTPVPFPVDAPPGRVAIGAGAARILLGGAIGAVIFETGRQILKRKRELDAEAKQREREAEINIELERARRRIQEREVRTREATEARMPRAPIFIPAETDPRDPAPDVIAEPLPELQPRRTVPPIEIEPITLPDLFPSQRPEIRPKRPDIPKPRPDRVQTPETTPSPATQPQTAPASPTPTRAPTRRVGTPPATAPFPTPTRFPTTSPVFLPFSLPFASPGSGTAPRIRRIVRRLTPSQPSALPFGSALPAPATSAPPTSDTRRCQVVKRRRRRKGKCREGFFEELPGRTKYVTWREVDCFSRKETKSSKARRKARDTTDRIVDRLFSQFGV